MVTLEQIKSVMIGHAIGDALGVPVEFRSRDYLRKHPVTDMIGYGTYPVPAGAWSDDTSMSLATLDSLLKNTVDYNDIMDNFTDWYVLGKYTPTGTVFDIGGTCRQAIENYRQGQGKPALECGLSDENANGNGSLMRIHPMCLYLNAKGMSTKNAFEIIHNTSALTHAHMRSKIACVIYSYFLEELLKEPDSFSLYKALRRILNEYVRQSIPLNHDEGAAHERECEKYRHLIFRTCGYFSHWMDEFEPVKESEIKSGGYVVDTLEAAMFCLLRTHSFEECVLKAVNLGDDTDTTAAVAGGLAGALYGYDAIPEKWKKQLIRKDYIEELCEKAFTAWTK